MKLIVDNTYTKIGLAIFSFILGLIATYIASTWKEVDKTVNYSIKTTPIISVKKDEEFKDLSRYYGANPKNINQYNIKFKNISDILVDNFNFLIFSNEKSKIEKINIATLPKRNINYHLNDSLKDNKIKIEEISLDLNQEIEVSFIVISKDEIELEIYPSGGGGAINWQNTTSNAKSLKENTYNLILLIVLAIIVPGIINLLYMSFLLFFSKKSNIQPSSNSTRAFAILGSSTRYLLIVMTLPTVLNILNDIPKMANNISDGDAMSLTTHRDKSPIFVNHRGDVTINFRKKE